jgi:hypothetical protein
MVVAVTFLLLYINKKNAFGRILHRSRSLSYLLLRMTGCAESATSMSGGASFLHSCHGRSMKLLFVLLVVLTTASAQGLADTDSCYSAQDVTVQYTVWVNTAVDLSSTADVTVRQFSPFYDVLQAAAEQEPATFGYVVPVLEQSKLKLNSMV